MSTILARMALAAAMGVVAWAGPAMPASAASADVAAIDNRLGFEIFRRLPAKTANAVMSPHSIGAAIAMALAGARGDTDTEARTALGFGPDTAALADGHRALNEAFSRHAAEGGPTVQVAHALHLTRFGHLVTPAYKRLLADRFGAPTFEGSDLATVNNWVKQATNGRIETILTRLDPLSVCVLLDAVYFKGAWASTFDKRATRPADFHLAGGEVVQVPTMHQRGPFRVLRAHTYDAIRLPYSKSGLGMIVVAPSRPGGLSGLEAGLDPQEAAVIAVGIAQSPLGQVDLSLPSFRIELGVDLIPPLRDIGVKLAFDRDRADFSGMTDSRREQDRLHISQVQHRAFIDVNEDGTEAAAATAVEFAKRAAPPAPATVLKIDRPFLFMITDEATGAVLFVGRVTDPRQGAAK